MLVHGEGEREETSFIKKFGGWGKVRREGWVIGEEGKIYRARGRERESGRVLADCISCRASFGTQGERERAASFLNSDDEAGGSAV